MRGGKRCASVLALLLGAFSWCCNVAAQRAPVDASKPTAVAGLSWQTEYMAAYRLARVEQRMLLVNFVGDADETQQKLEQAITADTELQEKLREMVLLRVASDAEVVWEGESSPLLSQAAFQEMHGRPGVAMIDLANEGEPFYGKVVSAYPFMTGKYYRWRAEYLPTILDLPPGTITQRTMVWAVRVHPERPASTAGELSPELAAAASAHSHHQARIRRQGHHNWGTRFHQVRAAVSSADATEIVAESWPSQTMIDSCLDCVASWRHSSGHWGAVKRRHRLFGYDIHRGRNGIWYGTGIFAN